MNDYFKDRIKVYIAMIIGYILGIITNRLKFGEDKPSISFLYVRWKAFQK